MGKTVLRIGVTCLAYAVTGFLLYRARAVSDSVFLDSDLLVFVLPAAVAFVVLLGILQKAGFGRSVARLVAATVIAGVMVALSFLVYLGVLVNLYGS